MSSTETVFSGGLLLAMLLAMLACLVSFTSPCILPLVPGYLGYLGGMGGTSPGVGCCSAWGSSWPGSRACSSPTARSSELWVPGSSRMTGPVIPDPFAIVRV